MDNPLVLKALERELLNHTLACDPHSRIKRSCNDEGNLGFNSFNFLTFMILSINAVININNNINNNNNNNNDISVNSISQTSNSIESTSNTENDISVVILPVPLGRRRRRSSEEAFEKLFFFMINLDFETKSICESMKEASELFAISDVILQTLKLSEISCDEV